LLCCVFFILLTYSTPLEDWEKTYLKLHNDTKDMVLKSLVTYPRTESIEKDKPLLVILIKTVEDLLDSKKEIMQAIELKALDGIRDILLVIDSLARVKDDILLFNADYVQIYKGGFDLLRFVIDKPDEKKSGRSIYIEINSYRKELMNTLKGEDYHNLKESFNWISRIFAVLFSLVLTLFPFFLMKKLYDYFFPTKESEFEKYLKLKIVKEQEKKKKKLTNFKLFIWGSYKILT